MPYGTSGRKSARSVRFRRRTSSKKGPAVTVRRRIPLAKKSTLMRLSRQVRYNTRQAQGKLQKSYQRISWSALPPAERYVNDIQCHLILLPGIQAGTRVSSNVAVVPPTGPITTITRTAPGAWREMVAPATDVNPLYAEFDQLLFYKNSLGVQSTYTLYKSMYTFNFYFKSCTGWIQIDKLSYRRNYQGGGSAPNVTDYNLPGASIGLINMAQGTPSQYSMNPQLFKRTRVLRKYFNTVKPPTDGHFLGTNPNYSVNLSFSPSKYKKLIRLRQSDTTLGPGATLPVTDDKTISKGCQEWLLISCSLKTGDTTSGANVSYDAYRTVMWRDQIGSNS